MGEGRRGLRGSENKERWGNIYIKIYVTRCFFACERVPEEMEVADKVAELRVLRTFCIDVGRAESSKSSDDPESSESEINLKPSCFAMCFARH